MELRLLVCLMDWTTRIRGMLLLVEGLCAHTHKHTQKAGRVSQLVNSAQQVDLSVHRMRASNFSFFFFFY